MPGTSFRKLITSTLRLYRVALAEAFRGTLKNWYVIFFHLLLIAGIAILTPILSPLGGMAGGFIMGLILALVVASYLSTVAAAVENEKIVWPELWPSACALFSPTISVLFLFFILSLLATMLFQGAGQTWLIAAVYLLLSVLCNPLPEYIYVRGGNGIELFKESFEFVKENFVEWFLPYAVLLFPILLISPALFVHIGMSLAINNPLRLVEMIILMLADPAILLQNTLLLIVFLYLFFFLFVFRGALFKRLATSTRRKRMYQELYS